jgi:hypothetical protein
MSSPSENAAERTAEDLPGNTAGRTAAERFCQVAGDLGANAAGDDLARCKAPAARVVGAEDAANERNVRNSTSPRLMACPIDPPFVHNVWSLDFKYAGYAKKLG